MYKYPYSYLSLSFVLNVFCPHAEQILLVTRNKRKAEQTQITLWMLRGAGVTGGVYLYNTIRGSFKQ
jgi:hypothetical protein